MGGRGRWGAKGSLLRNPGQSSAPSVGITEAASVSYFLVHSSTLLQNAPGALDIRRAEAVMRAPSTRPAHGEDDVQSCSGRGWTG